CRATPAHAATRPAIRRADVELPDPEFCETGDHRAGPGARFSRGSRRTGGYHPACGVRHRVYRKVGTVSRSPHHLAHLPPGHSSTEDGVLTALPTQIALPYLR